MQLLLNKLNNRLNRSISFLLIILLPFNNILAEVKIGSRDSRGFRDSRDSRGYMVLIEGLDLAGKSTLTKGLINQLKTEGHTISYSRNALVSDNPIAAKADILRKEPAVGLMETGSLFLAAHLYDIYHFKYPDRQTIHIQDSSWLRTIAYHSLHTTRWIPSFVDQISQNQPRFDLVIYLTASTNVRRQRVLKREKEVGGNDKADYMSWTDPKKVERHDALLWEMTLKYYPFAVKIDTTGLTSSEVLAKVHKFIKEQMIKSKSGVEVKS